MVDESKLRKNEKGERLDLKETFNWILKEMSYEDFDAFAKLEFKTRTYQYSYRYMVDKEHDSQKARKDYLKYLAYKLVQNVNDPRVRLRGREFDNEQ